ncbi:MAG: hypothetical protein IKY92_05305 [Akkermansia sp.]|nr:hypothetical protein [Akkermansia sp.]
MNILDAKPGQYCLVKVQVQGVIGGGLVVKMPAGPRVIIKPEYLDAVFLEEATAEVVEATAEVVKATAEVGTKRKNVSKKAGND